MPQRGVPNNPQGVNGFQGFNPNPVPYGDVQRTDQLQKAAPVPTPQGNAPERNQRRAVRGTPEPEAPVQMPTPADVAPQASVASIWQQVASLPGASPLVKQMAG